jgi:hypothetical protein
MGNKQLHVTLVVFVFVFGNKCFVKKDTSKHSLVNLVNNNCRCLDYISTVNIPNFLTFVNHSKELTLNKANNTKTVYNILQEISLVGHMTDTIQ